MTKILIRGNCHAQYFGTALASLPGVEVCIAGKEHLAVGFKRGESRFVTLSEGIKWISEAAPNDHAILWQVMPTTDRRRLQKLAPLHVIKFPIFKFEAPFVAPDADAGFPFGSAAF